MSLVLDHKGNPLPAVNGRAKKLSAYRGAGTGRLAGDWNAGNGDADSILIPERLQLIYRIRERKRNDPVLSGAVKRLVDSVIGPKGFRVQSELDYDRIGISEMQAQDIEGTIDSEWAHWQTECDYAGNEVRRCNFAQMLSLEYDNEVSVGESLAFARYKRRPGYRFDFCIQLIDTDRIMNPNNVSQWENVRDGIKIGSRGQVVGVYIAHDHPGSYYIGKKSYRDPKYIPAINRRTGFANFWHRFKCYRPEATRGEPILAASLAGYKHVGEYVGSELIRAEMAAMFGLLITREETFDPDSEAAASARELGDTYEKDYSQIDLYPGMVHHFQPGDNVSTANANIPGPQFDSFIDKLLTMVGSPLGLSREASLNSYSGMSFSAAKASRDDSERSFEKIQHAVFADYIAEPRKRVIHEAWVKGRLVLPGFNDPATRDLYFSNVYHPSPWPNLDPIKEAKAAEQRLINGTSSIIHECARAGVSFQEVVMANKKVMAEYEKAGLPLPAYLKEDPVPAMPSVDLISDPEDNPKDDSDE